MNLVRPLLGLVHSMRWTAVEVLRVLPRPDLEAGARRNARTAATQITTRRRAYANARAALLAEEGRPHGHG